MNIVLDCVEIRLEKEKKKWQTIMDRIERDKGGEPSWDWEEDERKSLVEEKELIWLSVKP